MNSKKLLVISDTHGKTANLLAVLNWAKERTPPNGTICAAVFLGDGLSDLEPAANAAGFFCDWKIVKGNNDYGYQVPESVVFDFADDRFFISHGHRCNSYNGGHILVAAAKNNGANIVLSGHSHVPHDKTLDGIRLINPGSVGSPRSRIGATFAVIECTEDKPLKVEFWGISEKGKIEQVKDKL